MQTKRLNIDDWVRATPNMAKRSWDRVGSGNKIVGQLKGNPPLKVGYDKRYPCMVIYYLEGEGPYMAFYSEEELEVITEKEVMLWKLANG